MTSSPAVRFLLVSFAFSILTAPAGAQHDVAPGDERRHPAETRLPASGTTAIMDVTLGKPIVAAFLNGRGPYRFYLDTGAAGTVLDRALFDELGITALGEGAIGDPANPHAIPVVYGRIDSVQFGEATFAGVPCAGMDRAALGGADAPRGVLGFPLFAGVLLTLDYPNRQVRLSRGELPPADGERIVEYRTPDGIPEVPVHVGGRVVWAHLDTGSPGGLMFPDAFRDSLALASEPLEVGRARTVNSEMAIFAAKLDGDVQIGTRTYEKPEVRFNSVLPAINLGYEYLREFAFTFDQAHARLLFEPGPRLPPQKRYGIRLGSAPDRFDVAGVEPGSPADLAGVLPGDRVIAVNGTPIGELSLEKRSAAMRAPHVTLEIARGDETLSVPMSLEDGK